MNDLHSSPCATVELPVKKAQMKICDGLPLRSLVKLRQGIVVKLA